MLEGEQLSAGEWGGASRPSGTSRGGSVRGPRGVRARPGGGAPGVPHRRVVVGECSVAPRVVRREPGRGKYPPDRVPTGLQLLERLVGRAVDAGAVPGRGAGDVRAARPRRRGRRAGARVLRQHQGAAPVAAAPGIALLRQTGRGERGSFLTGVTLVVQNRNVN